MKYLYSLLSLLIFQACSGPTVHYDYASTTLNGADFTYRHYAVAEPANPYIKVSSATYIAKNEARQPSVKISQAPSTKHALSGFTFKQNTTKMYNDFALIIGITKYTSNPNVPFANNSALAFEALAEKTFGLPKENIITLIDDKATSGSVKSQLHLIKELADKDSTVYFYFAGHGLPSKDGDTYLLPSDMSADAIEYETSLKLSNIYALLSNSLASKVVVVMDSCFSGKDDSGKLLYKGVAPVLKVRKAKPTDKMTIFTAGGSKDFANALDEKEHRMFSYHFIKAVNKGLTKVTDIHDFTRAKVKRASLHKGIGYKQIPQIDGQLERSLY